MKKGKKLWLFLLIALLAGSLALSCDLNDDDDDDDGNGPAPGPGAPTDEVTLSGTVADWPLEDEMTVRATAENSAGDTVTLGTSTIAADGSFSLTVPAPPDDTLAEVSDVSDDYLPGDAITADPSDVRILILTELEVLDGSDSLGSLMRLGGSQGFSIAAWVFSDQSASLSGSEATEVDIDDNGTPEDLLLTFDVELNEGWNEVFIDPVFGDDPDTPDEEDATATISNTDPGDMEWTAIGDFDIIDGTDDADGTDGTDDADGTDDMNGTDDTDDIDLL